MIPRIEASKYCRFLAALPGLAGCDLVHDVEALHEEGRQVPVRTPNQMDQGVQEAQVHGVSYVAHLGGHTKLQLLAERGTLDSELLNARPLLGSPSPHCRRLHRTVTCEAQIYKHVRRCVMTAVDAA